jgi:ArsR family transcriptional regulator
VNTLHKHLGKFFKCFCNEQRLAILEIIRKHKRINVNAIVKETTILQPTVSHHLKMLQEADIIGQEKSGKEIYYKLKSDEIEKCCKACVDTFGGASNTKSSK